MAESCCSRDDATMILACSGASNVGQLSNRAAVELTKEGVGRMFCLAGIGGDISGFVQSARDVQRLVVIDGCRTGCARAILEKALVPIEHYVVITEEGIEKNSDLDLKPDDIDRVKKAVIRSLGRSISTPGEGSAPSCTCQGPC